MAEQYGVEVMRGVWELLDSAANRSDRMFHVPARSRMERAQLLEVVRSMRDRPPREVRRAVVRAGGPLYSERHILRLLGELD